MRLNWGCGPWRAEGWHNIDVVEVDDIHPDQVVAADQPLPFPDGSCERIFMGHVLEHIPWPALPDVLADARRLLAPDGEILVVGPDVHRAMVLWRDGHPQVDWDRLVGALEGPSPYQGFHSWPGARHEWNCYEDRVVGVLVAAGFDPVPLSISAPRLDDWPVVSRMPDQCAVLAC